MESWRDGEMEEREEEWSGEKWRERAGEEDGEGERWKLEGGRGKEEEEEVGEEES